ncbi:MAG: hypothetical protein ABIY70_16295 [Capsulimonas sp.]|uniref:hypothetical protein n=1 Tax=Capsulimonas sp. TaxID=2494211 RepID=UPI003265A1BA
MRSKMRLWQVMPAMTLLTISVSAAHAQQGGGIVRSGAATSQMDPGLQTLLAGNVYVDPRLTDVNQGALEEAAKQGRDNPHTFIKIAALDTLPNGYRTRGEYTTKLHDSLNLGKNGLVVVVFHNHPNTTGQAGITVVSDGLTKAEETQLAKEAQPLILRDKTEGISALAQNVASKVNNKEYGGQAFLWGIFLVVVLAVVVLIVMALRKKKQNIAVAREPVEALRGNVLQGIEYLDNYGDVLPKNNPDSDQVRAFRQAASNKYDQASKILLSATEVTDINRAQGLLDRAQADIEQGRRALDRATGGTGNIPGDDAFRPEPLPASQPEVESIPQNQRGVSFFSSQPAPLNNLVPVTITVNGESRQVLATPEEADDLRRGQMPQVRAFNVNGQQVPWYAYNQYDPYRDYWHYQNSGWGGFGGGLLAGWVGAEVLGSLFAPHYGGGFGHSGYAYSTDNAYYQGYNDAANFGGGQNDAGGVDFMNPGSGDNYDNAGGVDFMNDYSGSGGSDSGGSDFGGSDFGGSDFGGGDFGGSDFGSSD